MTSDDDLDFEVVEAQERPRSFRERPERRKVREEGLAYDQPEREWAYLDRIAAREDIARFAERARRGECATWPQQEADWVGQWSPWAPPWRCGECHYDVYRRVDEEIVICVRCATKQGGPPSPPGSVRSADEPPPWSQPPYWTAPTVRLVACHPSASARSASSGRSEPMTLSRTDWQKDNTIPPKANEAVAQIMAERGVNRRRAYELLRAQKLAEVDTSSVGQGQRIAVLTCLITHPESGRDATVLLDALHRAGVKIDMHDTVKTLWVLQKTRYVQFREKGNRSLYAIKITDEGLRAYGEMSAPPAAQEVAVLSHVLELADEVIEQEEKAAEPERVVLSSMEFTVPLTPKPWPPDMEGWPALRDIRNRAEKAAKIGAALKLLEEVGEEDIALTLMGRIEFTELEEEVINLLKIMGEITE